MRAKHILGLLFLFCIPFVSAQITLYKSEYLPGETVQAELTATALSASEINLLDASGGKVNIAPLLLQKDRNDYLLYFDLPLTVTPGSYSLEAQGILQETFFIINNSLPILAVNPGFILLQEGQTNANVVIENKRTTTSVVIQSSPGISHVYATPQTVQENTKRTFKFVVDQSMVLNDATISVTYSNLSYSIPIILLLEESTLSEPVLPKKSGLELVTSVSSVNRTINQEQVLSGPLSFKNTLNESLFNLSIKLTGNLQEIVSLNISSLLLLEPNVVHTLHFWVNKEKNVPVGSYSGEISLSAGAHTLSLPMYLTVITEKTETLPEVVENKSAEEPKEKPSFTFFKPAEDTEEGPPKKEIKVGVLIFIIIFVLVVAIFLFVKSRKVTQKKSFDEFMQERKRRF